MSERIGHGEERTLMSAPQGFVQVPQPLPACPGLPGGQSGGWQFPGPAEAPRASTLTHTRLEP